MAKSGDEVGGENAGEPGRKQRSQVEVREHLANERTLLSWVRTGVGLISVGLVVERTGVLASVMSQTPSDGAAEIFGLVLALLGCLTLVNGTVQFLRNRRRISEGTFVPNAAAYMVVVAGSLVLAGAFIVYVLL